MQQRQALDSHDVPQSNARLFKALIQQLIHDSLWIMREDVLPQAGLDGQFPDAGIAEAQGTSPAGRQKEEGAEAGYRVEEKAAAGMPAQREGRRRQMGTLKGQLTIPEDFDRWLEDEIQALFAGQESSEAELLHSAGKAK